MPLRALQLCVVLDTAHTLGTCFMFSAVFVVFEDKVSQEAGAGLGTTFLKATVCVS